MKAITICQPYAHLILQGRKTCENRTWFTNYRGPIYIHAGKNLSWLDLEGDRDASYDIAMKDMQFGAVIAIANLVACIRQDSRLIMEWLGKMTEEQKHHVNGPFCWILDRVEPVGPWPWKGAQGLWDINVDERLFA